MNNITKKIILGAITTTTIASLPATAQAQQYPGYGYQGQPYPGQPYPGQPHQGLQNPGFDPYAGVNEMNRFIYKDMERQNRLLMEGMQGTSDIMNRFHDHNMRGLHEDASRLLY